MATPPAVDAFTIRIFADNTGEPAAAPLFSFAAGNAVSRSDTGQDTFVNGRDVFSYAFDLAAPVVLSADTLYWLSIVNDTPSGASQLWAWSSQPGGNGLTSSSNAPWTANGSATGFILTGDALTTVPEPESLALFGAGLAGLGFLRRRRGTTA